MIAEPTACPDTSAMISPKRRRMPSRGFAWTRLDRRSGSGGQKTGETWGLFLIFTRNRLHVRGRTTAGESS